MVKVIWTGPAYRDLLEIAEYIAVDNRDAADLVVGRVIQHVNQLEMHPESGSVVPEMAGSSLRQLVEPPCRIFYRVAERTVYILHVARFERLLRLGTLQERDDELGLAD